MTTDPDTGPTGSTNTDGPMPALEGTRPIVGDAGNFADLEGEPAMFVNRSPDAIVDAGTFGDLVIRAAAVRGSSHRFGGTPRQDHFCLERSMGGVPCLLVAVADGVSAGPESHLAARVATTVACEALKRQLEGDDDAPSKSIDDIDWKAVLRSAAASVVRQAARAWGKPVDPDADIIETLSLTAGSMATTLTLGVVPATLTPGESVTAKVMEYGDSAGAALRQGRWTPVTAVKGAGASGPVSSAVAALPYLPDDDLPVFDVVLQAGDALVLFTDGIGDAFGAGTTELALDAAQWWSTPPGRYAFAAQVDFVRRSHSDDRTAVAVWVAPSPVDDGQSPGDSPT